MRFQICVILAVVVATSAQKREVSTWIESSRVTNWGEWGPEDICPEGTYVDGFSLKVQPDQGFILDDTALNGIELSCVDPLKKTQYIKNEAGVWVPKVSYVKSSEGNWGSWGTFRQCFTTGSFATGFDYRAESLTLIDNTAGNNFAIYCEDGAEGTRLEGNGHSWGDWGGRIDCPRGMKICGIRTQIEAPKTTPPPNDNSAMNNVDLACCE